MRCHLGVILGVIREKKGVILIEYGKKRKKNVQNKDIILSILKYIKKGIYNMGEMCYSIVVTKNKVE